MTHYRTTLRVWTFAIALWAAAPLGARPSEGQPESVGNPVATLGRIRALSVTSGRRVLISTAGAGTYITRDDGRSWLISTIGLDSHGLSEAAFSPTFSKDETVFALGPGRLQRSLNRGHSWQATELRAPGWSQPLRHTGAPRFVGLHRFAPASLEPTALATSPRFAEDRTLFIGTRRHGIFRSLDAGASASQTWDADGNAITALAISPAYAGDRTLFAWADGLGARRSRDAGVTWEALEAGLPRPERSSNEKPPITTLLVSPNYAADHTLFAAGAAGLFRSTDRGDTWSTLGDDVLAAGTPIATAAVSPAYDRDGMLLVSAQPRAEPRAEPDEDYGGLYRGRGGGESFARISIPDLAAGEALHSLGFHHQYPVRDKIFAASTRALFVGVRKARHWVKTARPVRVEDATSEVTYEGAWTLVRRIKKTSAGSVHASAEGLAEVRLDFVGTGIAWVGSSGPDQGLAKVFLDDEFKEDVDQFASEFAGVTTSYIVSGLPHGAHSLRIVVLDDKNPSSSGTRVEVDAFDIGL